MDTKQSVSTRLTRRGLLKLSGTLAAGTLLVACAPAVEPTTAPEPTAEVVEEPTVEVEPTAAPVTGNVVVMKRGGEFTPEELEQSFTANNPGITVEAIEDDFTRFFAMYAAGDPPDILRVQAPSIPQFLARKIMYDLTPYFETSEILRPDDLAPANNYYMANSPMDIGTGKIYGMVKDWSPDFTVWIYKPAFEAAGVEIPSDTEPLTYQQIGELAEATHVQEGDRVATWGYGYGDFWSDRIWMNMLAETGGSLYADSFTKMNLAANEEAKAITAYYFDLAQRNLTGNPLNYYSGGWSGDDFVKGLMAMVQYGYWYSGMAETDVTAGNIIMIPGPTWAGERRDPTMTATGFIVAAATDVPDAAWKVFEWYNGLEPAVARAQSGWGVPGLKSLYALMPTEGDYRAQVANVLQAELDLATPALQFNPFIGESTVVDTWAKNLELALKGDIDFDTALANVESDTNTAIKEGIDRIT